MQAPPRPAVVIAVVACAALVARATPDRYDTLAHDERVLREVFTALRGRDRWPQTWREHWQGVEAEASAMPSTTAAPVNGTPPAPPKSSHTAPAFTSCVPQTEWRGATCQLTMKRIIRLCHRSGVANGEMPASVATMTRLELVDWSENHLSGGLPPFGSEPNVHLASIAFAGNALTGPIPPSLGRLVALRVLSLSRNHLSGAIPPELGDAVKLEGLLLDGNPELAGEVPWKALFRLKNLRHLRLDGCPKLSGTVKASEIARAFPHLLALELAGSHGIHLTWDDGGALAQRLHLLTLPTDEYVPDGRRAQRLPTAATVTVDRGHQQVHVPRGDSGAPLRFMAMGDFGTGAHMFAASRELASAYHFTRIANWVDSQFTITVGDNLYVPKWLPVEAFFHESFELPYGSSKELARPWFAGIGNHDNPSEVNYAAREKKWRMNVTEYAHRVSVLDGDAADEAVWGPTAGSDTRPPHLDLIVHDSVSKLGSYRGAHWNMMDAALRRSDARFKVSTAHYPPISSGCHPTHKLGKAWGALGNYHNITAFFAGHDHHSEALFDEKRGIFHFLVGGYARGPCAPHNSPHSLFKEPLLGGFAYVAVGPTLLNVTYVSEMGHIQFKVVVPHDWAARRMGRLPTPEEIVDYVRDAKARPPEKPATVPPMTHPETASATALTSTPPPTTAAASTPTTGVADTSSASSTAATAGATPAVATNVAPADDVTATALPTQRMAPADVPAPPPAIPVPERGGSGARAPAGPSAEHDTLAYARVRRQGYDVAATHGRHGTVAAMYRSGGALWWATAAVCVAGPLVALGAVLHDWTSPTAAAARAIARVAAPSSSSA